MKITEDGFIAACHAIEIDHEIVKARIKSRSNLSEQEKEEMIEQDRLAGLALIERLRSNIE